MWIKYLSRREPFRETTLKRSAKPNVRFGSLADITARSRHVRFTPNSGHLSARAGCPLCAISGHGGFAPDNVEVNRPLE